MVCAADSTESDLVSPLHLVHNPKPGYVTKPILDNVHRACELGVQPLGYNRLVFGLAPTLTESTGGTESTSH